MAELAHLCAPITLRGVEIPNRIVMSAHGTRLAANGLPTEALMSYYEARARGGLGLMVVSTYAVHPQRPAGGMQPSLWSASPDHQALHTEMIQRVVRHGTRIFAQIGYGGRQVSGEGALRPVQAPSGLPWVLGGEVPRAMTLQDIQSMVRSYGTAARRVRQLGFEGVEIHGAHGYLIHEFLSPAANCRTDEYGGSFDGRLRFLLEVLGAVRAEVGADYPVGLRLSGDEFVEGGTALGHQAAVAARVAATGTVDYVSQTAGAYRSMERIVLPPAFGQGAHVELSRRIKAAIEPLPLMAVGHVYDPKFADDMIGQRTADMVIMTRALIADPDLPRKAAEGRLERLRHCVGAMECWGRTRKNFAISCAVNAEAGREWRLPAAASARPARIAVVGAGPGGLEAAIRLADAGHRVVVFEQAAQTGGRLNVARRASGLQQWERFVADQRAAAGTRDGISVQLGTTVTADSLRAVDAAAIVVAAGARPRRLGDLQAPAAYSVDEALASLDRMGRRVAIYAETQHLSALALAETLARAGRTVTVLTPHAGIGGALDPNSYNDIRRRLAAAAVTIVPEVLFHRAEDGVLAVSEVWPSWPGPRAEPSRDIAFDTLVYDIGDEPRDELFTALDSAGLTVLRIGDCLTPRNVIGAVHDGAGVVAVIEQRLTASATA
jgi:2,4-dienoyl-CoA reductase-like NADH-dependent reductase (Old Yellow Enzyme family)/thioredoxin reductase